MSEFELDTFIDMPDDDDMPPLVDRPPPTMAMMTYSFDADFTPIPYSPDSLDADMAPEPIPRFELISEEDAPRISAAKPSHAKKRDAGHIPRPPNAFILFRSSFIKSESVPGNIEGNHSTLSKIIGIVWKTLPPAERELWEKRAVQAQAEHRARYPDWRFRPGTNVDALAKRKTKDKNKDRPPARRRRSTSTRDKDAPTGGGRCKARGVMQERRCAQIAGLLARGVKGVALTSAVQAWDKESGVSGAADGVFVTEQGVDVGEAKARAKVGRAQQDGAGGRGRKEMRGTKDAEATAAIKTRSASSAQQVRFNVPLTSMFRRASSVPLVPDHANAPQAVAIAINTASAVPDFYPPPPPLSPASSVSYGSELSFPESDNMNVPPMFDLVPFSPPDSPCSSNMDHSDIGALGPVSPLLGIGPAGAPPGQGPEDFFSNYSTLCGWAGGIASITDDNNPKLVLPPLSPPYGCLGEMDHPFSFMHVAAPAVADPWNNFQDLVVRPTFGGSEDTWAGARGVATVSPYA